MNIITGRPHRLLEICIDRIGMLASEGERCMLLVPSQYTLQAEVEVMNRLKTEGTFLIDILSPARLRSRVFERAGRPQQEVIDQRGKCMVVSAVLEQQKEALTLYKQTIGATQGLAKKLSDAISDFKRSGVTPGAMKSAAQQMEEGAAGKNKLEDLERVYTAYEAKLAGKLADDEDVAGEVRKRMERSGVLKAQHVFVYGFDMITPSFAEELLHIQTLAKSVSIAVETDKNSAPDGRLFAPVNASIERLISMARERDVQVKREHIDKQLEASEGIRTLERKLFALGAASEKEAPKEIEVTAAGTPRSEVHAAAAKIREMAAEGEEPAEMAVVYTNAADYAALIESIFPLYGLHPYVAEKRSAASNPLCRFLLSALEIVSGGWRTADVIECVKSGFLPVTAQEADAISSYAEGVDLRGDGWKHPFTYIKDAQPQALETLNQAREKIVNPLTRLGKRCSKAKTADDAVTAVMALLEETEALAVLEKMCVELKEQGQETLAQDCAQVWNRVMETLDQLHTLLEGEQISTALMLELLHSGLSAMELSALPPAEGAVICGRIGNVRTARVKTLFAIGMNDSGASGEQGLFTAQEMEEAERATNAYLGMSASERAALAQLDELKAICCAKENLYISYALADETGKAQREGTAVAALKRLFPQMTMNGGLSGEELRRQLCAPQAAVQALSVMLGEAADGKADLSAEAAQAYAVLRREPQRREQLTQITRRLSQPNRQQLDAAQARTLYGRPVMSVSRLETFAQCPYKHFVRYGLYPAQEIQPGVDRAEVGTLFHEAAEKFTRAVSKLPGFPEVEAAACDEIMNEAVGPLIDEWRKSPLGESKRGAAIAEKIRKTARRTGRNIISQYAGGSFEPLCSELVFGQGDYAPITLELADGSVIFLQGRIDRVDMMDGRKIRIIDYKSGAKKFDPTMAYWGLQLQLMIYLAAAMSRIPGSSAAGFFYCRIADPTIRSESRIKEEIERQLAKKLALAGVTLSDVTVLRAHGESHAAMITKEGKPNGRYAASMVDEAGMHGLISFADKKATSIAQDVYRGIIDDAPAEYGQYDACSTCSYAAVCGFDPSRKARRRLTAKKLEDLTGGGGKN